MLDHIEEHHPELSCSERENTFAMEVIHKEYTAYARQIREETVIMIQDRKGPGLINKKQEYNKCWVLTLGTINISYNKQKHKRSVEERTLVEDPDERLKETEEEHEK